VIELGVVGRKARDYFKRRAVRVRSEHVGVFQALPLHDGTDDRPGPDPGLHGGRAGPDLHRLQRVQERHPAAGRGRADCLPIERLVLQPSEPAVDYLYEPGAAQIFESILPKHVEVQVWRALLESAAAEHGARMTAMDAATQQRRRDDRPPHAVHDKVRQAAITKGDHRGRLGGGLVARPSSAARRS